MESKREYARYRQLTMSISTAWMADAPVPRKGKRPRGKKEADPDDEKDEDDADEAP